VYGVFADLVCGLGAAVTDEIGFLHFAMTEQLFVSARRQSLHALEATRRSLRAGSTVGTTAGLLEVIVEHTAESIESYADALAEDLDRVEERLTIAEPSDQNQVLGRVRKIAVRLHRQLVTQRSQIHRFERDTERSAQASLQFAGAKLVQRLDALDHDLIALRDRSHLLQEEVSLRMADQTNRNLQVLAIVTTVFLPANLIAAIFGMNVAGLPLTVRGSGFAWALVLLVGVSALVFWLLRRSGMLGR
jgi:zinc transporter